MLNPIKNPIARLFLGFKGDSDMTGSLETMLASTEEGNKLNICVSNVNFSSTFKLNTIPPKTFDVANINKGL